MLPKDTVCLSRTASVGYVVIMGKPMATSQDFVTWTCCELLDPRFLAKALLAEGEDIRRFGEGSTHTTIYFPEVKAFHIGLPPVGEQQRIVAKIDSLSAKSRRARDHLNHIPRLVEKYKQAILATAFGRIDRDANRASVGALSEHITSGSRDWSQYYGRGNCVFVLAGNVKPMAFDPSPKQYVDPPLDTAEAKRTLVKADDLLFTIVGAKTGDVCRVPTSLENYFVCQSVALVRLREPERARYVELFLNTLSAGQGQIHEAIYGQGRPHLSFADLKRLEIPIIGIPETQAFVERIEVAFREIDRLASETANARKLIDHLDESVLAKAFRGELVQQDPDDEPASILLERIKTERSAAQPRRERESRG
jgi:type I restriction enzyme, S subunit